MWLEVLIIVLLAAAWVVFGLVRAEPEDSGSCGDSDNCGECGESQSCGQFRIVEPGRLSAARRNQVKFGP